MKPESIGWAEAAKKLQSGQIGVIPTDTLYGMVGLARRPAVVERVYVLRRRELHKPLITLISNLDQLTALGGVIDARTRELFERVWPGPVSLIVTVPASEMAYIHRGTQSIAFRMPKHEPLRRLIEEVGPLVAPSANIAGEEPATTIEEARAAFGDAVFYIEGGYMKNPPSALVDSRVEPMRVLRPAPGFPFNKS
jgi:L-threonylcarbamoyladenylate synthase